MAAIGEKFKAITEVPFGYGMFLNELERAVNNFVHEASRIAIIQ